MVEDFEPNLAQAHTAEAFLCHEAGRFGAIALAPDIFLTDDYTKERRDPVPAIDAVRERGRPDESLALALMDREAIAASRGRQDECFEIATRLCRSERLKIMA